MWTARTQLLIKESGIEKLKSSHVAVVGIVGVGGYTTLMLARAGVGNLTLVDFDKVDESNINRQVVATTLTVGRYKTDIMKELILAINPACNVTVINERYCTEMQDKFFETKYDYIVDAIDSVGDKVDLICEAKTRGQNIVSAMGAGNRIDIPNFSIVDIYKTSHDGLAKVMRKKLRERNLASLDVAISDSVAIKTDNESNEVGSISYYPAMCGCVLSAFVLQKLID